MLPLMTVDESETEIVLFTQAGIDTPNFATGGTESTMVFDIVSDRQPMSVITEYFTI